MKNKVSEVFLAFKSELDKAREIYTPFADRGIKTAAFSDEARSEFELCLLSSGATIRRGKIYLSLSETPGALNYTLLDQNGLLVNDVITTVDLPALKSHLTKPLQISLLKNLQSKILDITSKRGQTLLSDSLMKELYPLLNLVMPHKIRHISLVQLELLKNRFQSDWAKEEAAPTTAKSESLEKRRARYLTLLRNKLNEILSPLRDQTLIGNINLLTESVREPADLELLFRDILSVVQPVLKKKNIENTQRDVPRGVLIGGFPVKNLQDFIDRLKEKQVSRVVIDYLCEYLNQEALVGDMYLLKQAYDFYVAEDIEEPKSTRNFRINLEVEGPDSVIVTLERVASNYYGPNLPNTYELPNAEQSKCSSKIRISLKPDGKQANYDDLEIELDQSRFDIFNPSLRKLFVKYRGFLVESKIKCAIPLTANDQLSIKQHLDNFRRTDGHINENYLSNEKVPYLLFMWNSISDAMDIFDIFVSSAHSNHTKEFFQRPVDEISHDFRLIRDKFHYSSDVSDRSKHFIYLLKMLEDQDIAAIKHELKHGDRNQLLLCLHSVRDVGFIKKLMKSSDIARYLDVSVLTHFAVQDRDVAKSILHPSWWQRTKNFLLRRPPLPYHHFLRDASPHLSQIITRHPSFWDDEHLFGPRVSTLTRLFGFYPQYRYKLTGKDINRLVHVDNEKNEAFFKAMNVFSNDGEVNVKARRDRELPIEERTTIFRDNPLVTIQDLVKDSETWEEMHWIKPNTPGLNDNDLADLYKAKLNLDYQILDINLLHALEDLFADKGLIPKYGPWSKVRELPEKFVNIARNVAISELSSKTFNVPQSTLDSHYKVPNTILLAELFITQPLRNAYSQSAFSGEKLREFQKQILSNRSVFLSFFSEPELKPQELSSYFKLIFQPKDANPDLLERQKKELIENFSSLIKNPNFNEALKLSRGFNKAIKSIIDHPRFAELIENNLSLTQFKNNFPEAPKYSRPNAHTCLQQLFEDEIFAHCIEPIAILNDFYQELLICTRFKKKMQEPDFLLFEVSWNYLKDVNMNLDMDKLLELISLFPEASLKNWLDENEEAVTSLIDKLVSYPKFYAEFKALELKEVESVLIRKASLNIAELKLVLFNCEELGLEYLDLVKKATSSKSSLAKDNAINTQFQTLINKLDYMELGLLVAKYPDLLLRIEKAGLFSENEKKINKALAHSNLIIKETDLQKIRAVTDVTERKMTKLNSPARSLEFETEYQFLSTTTPQLCANYFIKKLSGPHNEDLICSLLENRKIINLLLDIEHNNLRKMPSKLGKIAALLSEKLTDREKIVDKEKARVALAPKSFIDFVFQKLIIKPEIRTLFIHNPLLLKYFNEVASPELVAKFLMLNKANLSDWQVGLSKAIFLPSAHELFPNLFSYPNFGTWFVKNKQERTHLFGLKIWDEVTQEKLVSSIIKEGDFDNKDLITWLLEQYEGVEHPSEPLVREILNNDNKARYRFLKNSFYAADELLEVAIQELGRDMQSPLASDILSEPCINHMLENASSEQIYRLFLKLRDLGMQTKESFILERLTSLMGQKDDVCFKHANSKDLLTLCLRYTLDREKEEGRRFIIKLSHLVSLSVDPTDEHKISKLFTKAPDDPNGLIEYCLARLSSHELDEQFCMQLEHLLSEGNFRLMLSSQANPHLIIQLIISLFKLSEALMGLGGQEKLVDIILNQLVKIRAEGQDSILKHILDGLDANEIIDLLVLDGSFLPPYVPSEEVHQLDYYSLGDFQYLKDDISHSANLCNRLYIEADETRLLELFQMDQNIASQFVVKAQEDSSIGSAIRKRLCQSENLRNFLIRELSSEESQSSFNTLVANHSDVFSAFVSSLVKDSTLLFDKNDPTQLRREYFTLLIEHGNSDNLDGVLRAVESKELVFEVLYQLLNQTDVLPHLFASKLINLFAEPEPQFNLIELLLDNLSVDQLVDILKQPNNGQLDKAFQCYFDQYPQAFEALFMKDFEQLKIYFQYNIRQRMNLYLLLNQKLPESPLTVELDKELAKDLVIARTMLSTATPAELIEIFSREQSAEMSGLKNLTPLSDQIFENSVWSHTLFKSLHLLDEQLILCDKIKNALENSVVEKGDITSVEICLKSFSRTTPLYFIADETKSLTTEHNRFYLFLRSLDAYHKQKIVQEEKIYHVNNEFIKLVKLMVANFNSEGVLEFHSPKEPVPLSDALSFYVAHSRFFYQREYGVQELIEENKHLCNTIVDSIRIDEDGNCIFSLPDIESEVPHYYLHMVLYAYCQLNDTLDEIPIGWAKAFINSVTVGNNQLIFTVNDNFTLPAKYQSVVQQCLRDLLQSGDELDEWDLAKISLLPDIDQHLSNEKLRTRMMSSVYLDAEQKLRFRVSHEQVPEHYEGIVYKLMREKYPSPDFLYLDAEQKLRFRVTKDQVPAENLVYGSMKNNHPNPDFSEIHDPHILVILNHLSDKRLMQRVEFCSPFLTALGFASNNKSNSQPDAGEEMIEVPPHYYRYARIASLIVGNANIVDHQVKSRQSSQLTSSTAQDSPKPAKWFMAKCPDNCRFDFSGRSRRGSKIKPPSEVPNNIFGAEGDYFPEDGVKSSSNRSVGAKN